MRCLNCFLATAAVFLTQVVAVSAEDRSYDGSGNNLANPNWGAANQSYLRWSPAQYGDGVSTAGGVDRPNPRLISNGLFNQPFARPSERNLSGYVYGFGNFISHDIQLTISGSEPLDFTIPDDDPIFRPGTSFSLDRSIFDESTGTNAGNPREQINHTSAYIDGSQIYSAISGEVPLLRGDAEHPPATLLNSNQANGGGENLLPRVRVGNVPDEVSFGTDFLAGDVRVNDNIVLTSLHTVFLREHNRLVGELKLQHNDWSEEQLFQRARKLVGAQLQVITYNEFLPALLGPYAPSLESEYDPKINAQVANEFAAVFLRFGHTMLTNDHKKMDNEGDLVELVPLFLARDNPELLPDSATLDLFLKGLSLEVQEEVDTWLVPGMRFGALGAIDIQRGRDHGIADYNSLREALGLERVDSFAGITANVETQRRLQTIYGNVDSIDAIVGALSEDHLEGASAGPVTVAAMVDPFIRLRDGGRFWFSRDPSFTPEQIDELRQVTLGDLIERNSNVRGLQYNVFVVPEPICGKWLFSAAMLYLMRLRGRT